jgi:DNA-binding Xre family transcriptional regulator
MIVNTVKEYLSVHHQVKDATQLAKETGLPESTCRWMMNKPKNTVSDRVLDVLCKRYDCTVGELKRYVPDNLTANISGED